MHTYLRLVLDRFDCYGTWLPGTHVYVGEIGKLLGGGSFAHTGDLGDRTQEEPPSIMPIKEPPQQAMAGATASRSGGATVAAGEILQALGDASASVTMKMAKRNSAALILEDVTRKQFSDERDVRQLMATMLDKGLMDLDEVVITYVLEAESGIVATSSASDATAEGGAGVDLGVSEFQLGKVGGKLAVVSGETSDTLAVAGRDRPLTPMYRLLFFRGGRAWPRFWRTEYTVETLIEAAASLRSLSRGSQASFGAYGRSTFQGRALGRLGTFEPELATGSPIDVISSSRPSLALAEHALQDLEDAGLDFGGLPLTASGSLGSAAGLGFDVEMPVLGGVRFADLHNDLGRVLQAQGDLEGAQRQFERAIAWAQAERTGPLQKVRLATRGWPGRTGGQASSEAASD